MESGSDQKMSKEEGDDEEALNEGEDEQVEEEGGVVDPADFPTLELTLDEARRTYDDEEQRRDSVEGKIGIVVTVDALLISFGALFSDIHALILGAVLTPALISAGLGLYTIRARPYKRPAKDIGDFYQYKDYDAAGDQREQLLLDYVDTTKTNMEMNEAKFRRFNYCIALTGLSLFLLLIAPVTTYLWSLVVEILRFLITESNLYPSLLL